MNKLKVGLIILINLILQTTVISRINILGVKASLSIPIIIGLAIGFGPYVGGFSGLIIGLIEDILFSKVLGVRALIYFIIGFIIGNSEVGINKDDVRSGLVLTIIATIGNYIGNVAIGKVIGQDINILKYLLGPILIEIIINSLLYVLVFYLFKKIFVFPRFRL
ncbi:rod shape-determining protein MreD [Peptostreptococcaceae bacterium OttesenSCG-928-C18]|nr:rod shape-determining protein MreD [Peptostreptococcaceae bacterium OttesenSCG-928-C18]